MDFLTNLWIPSCLGLIISVWVLKIQWPCQFIVTINWMIFKWSNGNVYRQLFFTRAKKQYIKTINIVGICINIHIPENLKLNQFGRLEIYLFNYGNSKCKIINYCRSPRFFLSKKVLALLKTPYYFISVFRPQSYFYFSILVVFTSQEIRVRYVLCSVDELNNFSAFLFCFSIFCFSYFIFVFIFF